ncbi:MAG TPA: class II aldolase/adducin family protein [Solirubrobacteraceae bacterium]|nr:class II aldolase/adducin family protein [Solirubrobacteraceae bacterium]
MYPQARSALARTARALAAEGLVLATAGNLSVREGEHLLVSPTGAQLGALEPEHVAVVDRDGALVDGPFAATSEMALHLALYRRPDVGAVVHAHAPIASALACVQGLREIPVVHYGMLELGGSVRVAPYATYGTQELADLVAAAMEGRQAALMASHGAVSVGPDLDGAIAAMRLLEWSCGVYWRASAIGTAHVLSEAELEGARAAIDGARYGALQPAAPPTR